MPLINVLPWRTWQEQRRKKKFLTLLLLLTVLLLGLALFFRLQVTQKIVQHQIQLQQLQNTTKSYEQQQQNAMK